MVVDIYSNSEFPLHILDTRFMLLNNLFWKMVPDATFILAI